MHVVAPDRPSDKRTLVYVFTPHQEALKDLQYLRDTSPEESNVLFQLAKVYRLLGDSVKFTQLLAEVRDVAPKSLAKIRKLTEGVDNDMMDEG